MGFFRLSLVHIRRNADGTGRKGLSSAGVSCKILYDSYDTTCSSRCDVQRQTAQVIRHGP